MKEHFDLKLVHRESTTVRIVTVSCEQFNQIVDFAHNLCCTNPNCAYTPAVNSNTMQRTVHTAHFYCVAQTFDEVISFFNSVKNKDRPLIQKRSVT